MEATYDGTGMFLRPDFPALRAITAQRRMFDQMFSDQTRSRSALRMAKHLHRPRRRHWQVDGEKRQWVAQASTLLASPLLFPIQPQTQRARRLSPNTVQQGSARNQQRLHLKRDTRPERGPLSSTIEPHRLGIIANAKIVNPADRWLIPVLGFGFASPA